MTLQASTKIRDLDYAAMSDLGLRRANNQDSYSILPADQEEMWRRRGHLFLVADGMGAHAAGELASKLAADNVPHAYHKLVDLTPPEALRKAIEEVNHEVYTRGQANPDFQGMGTTCSALLLLPEGAVVAHIGDSRVYRLRADNLEQLSFDHSLVWEMIAAGEISKDAVPAGIPTNVITRSLGPNPEIKVDLEGPFPVEEGDTYLLCSDGLTGMVNNEELGSILGCLSPKDAAKTLVDLANLRGGSDNITLIIARVTGPSITEDAEPASGGGLMQTILWSVVGLCALTAIILTLLKMTPAAIVSGVGAVVAALFGWAQKQFGFLSSVGGSGSARLGQGPHDLIHCPANSELVGKLAKVLEEMREAAQLQKWSVDWDQFKVFIQQAAAAAGQEQYVLAVREYCHAISFLMDQLRSKRKPPKGISDSTVDLF